ncbi:MAG: response regulator [Bacteriovoracaceae bacterium]|nr:response regulator [Bacteroidota bacterium]
MIEPSEKNIPPASVWIVEDNKIYRQNISTLVSSVPWIVEHRAFDTGEKAIESVQDETPPDLLLLDLGLPGIDGITTLKKIKRVSPVTKVLILTIQDDADQVFQAISAGADGYLLKDLTPDSIIRSIEEVLRGGSPINAFIASKILSAFKKNTQPTIQYGLTDREKEILEYLVQGVFRKKIADKLFLSYHTVDFHIRNIYGKLQVNTQSDAVAKSIREKIV